LPLCLGVEIVGQVGPVEILLQQLEALPKFPSGNLQPGGERLLSIQTEHVRIVLVYAIEDVRRQQLQPKLLPQSTLRKAMNYFLNEYEALIGYLRDGRFEMDSNLIENSIRPTAVGRRRWLFIGHPLTGWRSAVIYSILLSRRRRGINPQNYLTDVLGRLPSTKITQIQELLPAHWKPPSANTS
jgi:transposase